MIRATRVRFHVRFLEERGIRPEATLAGSGIAPSDLLKPDHAIEPVQLRKVIGNVALLCPEPGVGLLLGAALRISDLGIIGHALMSCGTLADALPLWDGHNELIGTPIFNRHRFKGSLWIIDFTEAMPLGTLLPLCTEEHLTNIQVLNQLLVNAPMRFREIRLSYPEPAHGDLYRSTFACPVKFGQHHPHAVFDASQLAARVTTADNETYGVCMDYCRNILAKLSNSGSLASQIRSEFFGCRGRIPAIGEVAVRLGQSERTLRRRLQGEGETYVGIVNRYRQDMAIEYLRNTTLEPKQIGHILGFESVSSFRRALKKWTGKTARACRAEE